MMEILKRLKALPIWIKGLIKASLLSITLASLFLSYLYFIGIPKTNARNLYNQAETALSLGNIDKAYMLLRQAVNAWPEEYIVEELKSFPN